MKIECLALASLETSISKGIDEETECVQIYGAT